MQWGRSRRQLVALDEAKEKGKIYDKILKLCPKDEKPLYRFQNKSSCETCYFEKPFWLPCQKWSFPAWC